MAHTTDLQTNFVLIVEDWETNTKEGGRGSFAVEKFEMICKHEYPERRGRFMLIFDDAGKAPFLSKTQLWCKRFEIKPR